MTKDGRNDSVEQARQAAKTTIVGGQPPGNERPLAEVPVGLERLLAMAAASEPLRRELLADRDRVMAASNVALTDTEQAVLRATPASQLEKMIAQVDTALPQPERRQFLEQAAAALAILVGVGGVAACQDKKTPSPAKKPEARIAR